MLQIFCLIDISVIDIHFLKLNQTKCFIKLEDKRKKWWV